MAPAFTDVDIQRIYSGPVVAYPSATPTSFRIPSLILSGWNLSDIEITLINVVNGLEVQNRQLVSSEWIDDGTYVWITPVDIISWSSISGYFITVWRVYGEPNPASQDLNPNAGSVFDYVGLANQLAKTTRLAQRALEMSSRSLQVDPQSRNLFPSKYPAFTGEETELPGVTFLPAPLKVIGINSNGEITLFDAGIQVYGSDSIAPTPNFRVLRDAQGRSQVVDPLASQDIATKGYVDSNGGVAASFIPGATIDNLTTFGYLYSGGGSAPTGSEGTGTPAIDGGVSGPLTANFNTVNPLAGTKDFKLTKASATLGAGWWKDFTIDRAYFGMALQIAFPYWNTDSDDVLQVFLYDVTNVNFIPISDPLLKKSATPGYGVSPNQYFATFFTPAITASRQFRLYIHGVSAGVASTFNLDNITVSKQTTVNASVLGGWNAYTPASNFTNLPGSWNFAKWRREGSMMRIQAVYTASGAATGNVTLANNALLPALGLTPDSTIEQEWQIIALSSGVGLSGSQILNGFGSGGSAGMYAGLTQWNATVPFTWKNMDRVFIDISIPIAQWGVNVNLASDFTEYASNDGSGGVAAGTTYNTGSVYGPDGSNIPSVNSSTSGQITLYRATFQRLIQPSDKIFLELKSSGSTAWKDAPYGNPLVTQGGFFYGCWWDYDTIDPSGKSVKVLFGNGGGVPGSSYNVAGAPWSNYAASKYRVRKVSNGNMAEVPPVVRAEYNNAAAQTVADTQINFQSKVEDTHSAVTVGASWKFTTPTPGVYLLESTVVGANSATTVRLFKNGSPLKNIGSTVVGLNTDNVTTIRLAAGDIVDLRPQGNGIAAGALSSISISRIGA
jgi:hypothetical protein